MARTWQNALLQFPRANESFEAAVEGFFHIGRETTAGQFPRQQVVTQALTT
jgi:hypothetical protein